MVRGGWGGVRVLLVSSHLTGCREYGDIKFFDGVNPKNQFRGESSTFLARWLALGAMAQVGKGRGMGNRWCSHVQDTLNLQGRHFFFRGGTTIQKLFAVNPVLGPEFVTFFAITAPWGRGEGRGRVPLVSSWAGDMVLVCERLFCPRRHHHSSVNHS
jgi:hypothetical protein